MMARQRVASDGILIFAYGVIAASMLWSRHVQYTWALGRPDARVLGNTTHSNNAGGANIVTWRSGRMDVQLNGWGTGPLVEQCFDEIIDILERTPGLNIFVFLDMRRGIGSAPRAVRAAFKFLSSYGCRIKRVAVIGPLPIMSFMKMVASVAHQEGVDFFFNLEPAETWLLNEMVRFRNA